MVKKYNFIKIIFSKCFYYRSGSEMKFLQK